MGDRGEMLPSAPACRFGRRSRLVTLSLSVPSEDQCAPEELNLCCRNQHNLFLQMFNWSIATPTHLHIVSPTELSSRD